MVTTIDNILKDDKYGLEKLRALLVAFIESLGKATVASSIIGIVFDLADPSNDLAQLLAAINIGNPRTSTIEGIVDHEDHGRAKPLKAINGLMKILR